VSKFIESIHLRTASMNCVRFNAFAMFATKNKYYVENEGEGDPRTKFRERRVSRLDSQAGETEGFY
jgi:hypothetical protein